MTNPEPEFDLCPDCFGDRLIIPELSTKVCLDCGAMEEMNASQKTTSDSPVQPRRTAKA
jgi:hypothetical protein